jgi:peptide/nickel transport system permease protein
MGRFLLLRLLYGLLVVVAVIVLISSIIFLSPVDPAQLTFGQRVDVTTVKAKQEALGLNRSLGDQLLAYLNDISPIGLATRETLGVIVLLPLSEKSILCLKKPNLRESYQSGRPVAEILAQAIPATLILACAAMLFSICLGVPMGIISALKPRSFIDFGISLVSVLGYSLPSYVVAMGLALLMGYLWSDWTGLGVQGSLFVLDDFGDWQVNYRNLVLPVLALGLRPVALIAQLTRSSMLDALSQDYIRTARAKGVSERRVVFRHALTNALNPLISATSGWFAALLTGSFFVETVFNFKGMGDTTVQALLAFDLPVVLGAVLFTAFLFIIINLIVDLIYGLADPRIRIR